MPNKYYLRHDRTAVKPEMNEPEWPGFYESDIQIIEYYNQRTLLWDQHIQSLPALDVDPDYLKRLSPGWFEGDERYEFLSIPDAEQSWLECTKEQFDLTNHKYRRLTIVAPQEAEKGQEGEVTVQRPWEAAIDYCNENGITGENELRQNFKSFLAGHSYAAASRPSDAVEFAEWLGNNYNPYYDGEGSIYWSANLREKNYTTAELYQLFLQSKSPNPNK